MWPINDHTCFIITNQNSPGLHGIELHKLYITVSKNITAKSTYMDACGICVDVCLGVYRNKTYL